MCTLCEIHIVTRTTKRGLSRGLLPSLGKLPIFRGKIQAFCSSLRRIAGGRRAFKMLRSAGLSTQKSLVVSKGSPGRDVPKWVLLVEVGLVFVKIMITGLEFYL